MDLSDRRPLEGLLILTVIALIIVGVVTFLTHVVAPRLLSHYEHFPALAGVPKRTLDAKGHLGDPVNVAIVASDSELTTAMRLAHWTRADSLSLRSDFGIAKSVLLDRPDSTAPVSSLFLFGRKQDVAFEQQVGRSARRRHHVRLWRVPGISYDGRPVWIGAATFDERAGISKRGMHPTHHIAPDVDEERDALERALANARQAKATFRVTGMGVRVDDHNAEGDRFDTDGELRAVVIPPANAPSAPPADPGVPPLVALKDKLWALGHHLGRPESRPSNFIR